MSCTHKVLCGHVNICLQPCACLLHLLFPLELVNSWSGIRKEVSCSQIRLFALFFFFQNSMGVELGTHINLQRSLLVTNAEATQTCRAGVRTQPPAEGGGQTTSERRCVLATTRPLPSHLCFLDPKKHKSCWTFHLNLQSVILYFNSV